MAYISINSSGAQAPASGQDGVPTAGIFPRITHVLAALHGPVLVPNLSLLTADVFLHQHGVGPVGQHCSSHDSDALAGAYPVGERRAGKGGADNFQHYGA